MSSATFYKYLAQFGGTDASMVATFKELEEEKRRLKKVYAEERLKSEMRPPLHSTWHFEMAFRR